MKNTLIMFGLGLVLLAVGVFGGYFYAKAQFKKEIPSLLKPLRDSLIERDKITDSLILDQNKWVDPQIQYKIIYRETKKVDEAKTYFQLDSSAKFQHFRKWVRSLPVAPDSVTKVHD